MNSIGFPVMIKQNRSSIVEEKEAVQVGIHTLLQVEPRTLLGDPMFGVGLKQLLFDQSFLVVEDLLIDKLYTAIVAFIPQVYLKRSDIKITIDRNVVSATIRYTYLIDNTADMFKIKLLDLENVS